MCTRMLKCGCETHQFTLVQNGDVSDSLSLKVREQKELLPFHNLLVPMDADFIKVLFR